MSTVLVRWCIYDSGQDISFHTGYRRLDSGMLPGAGNVGEVVEKREQMEGE